jgi:hypothetical protein
MDLDEFVERLPPIRRALLMVCSPDSCIETSRAIQLLLRDCGHTAGPIPVQVRACNQAAWEFVQRRDWQALRRREGGAYAVNVGDPNHQPGPGKWAGHLAVLSGNTLIDASIDQASRPEHGILLEPLAFDVPSDFFLDGGSVWRMNDHGVALEYTHLPTNRGYRSTPAWRNGHTLLRLARAGLREAGAARATPAGPRPPR